MGNPKAFLEIHRQEAGYRPIHDRIHDFGEVEQTLSTRERKLQASRCMDCGVPFCHWACPLGNKAPQHEPLPRVHGSHLSCALRESLRAEPFQPRAHHKP